MSIPDWLWLWDDLKWTFLWYHVEDPIHYGVCVAMLCYGIVVAVYHAKVVQQLARTLHDTAEVMSKIGGSIVDEGGAVSREEKEAESVLPDPPYLNARSQAAKIVWWQSYLNRLQEYNEGYRERPPSIEPPEDDIQPPAPPSSGSLS